MLNNLNINTQIFAEENVINSKNVINFPYLISHLRGIQRILVEHFPNLYQL